MSPRKSHYVHGTTPAEQQRLTLLNRLLNDSSLEAIRLAGGERILDVGAGLGQFTRALARAAGGVRVLGIERSPEQIAEALRQAREAGEEGLIELRQGDATDPPLLDGEWGSFDLAHARFILEHVTDPVAVVRAMVRAVRPCGRIVLEDDDHDILRIWPEPPGLLELWRAYMTTYDRAGNDPLIGRKLVELLHRAGAAPRANRWLFFGAASGHPDMPAFVENIVGVFTGARDAILATGVLKAGTFEETLRRFRDWGERPDAAIWFARSWAEGVKPG